VVCSATAGMRNRTAYRSALIQLLAASFFKSLGNEMLLI